MQNAPSIRNPSQLVFFLRKFLSNNNEERKFSEIALKNFFRNSISVWELYRLVVSKENNNRDSDSIRHLSAVFLRSCIHSLWKQVPTEKQNEIMNGLLQSLFTEQFYPIYRSLVFCVSEILEVVKGSNNGWPALFQFCQKCLTSKNNLQHRIIGTLICKELLDRVPRQMEKNLTFIVTIFKQNISDGNDNLRYSSLKNRTIHSLIDLLDDCERYVDIVSYLPLYRKALEISTKKELDHHHEIFEYFEKVVSLTFQHEKYFTEISSLSLFLIQLGCQYPRLYLLECSEILKLSLENHPILSTSKALIDSLMVFVTKLLVFSSNNNMNFSTTATICDPEELEKLVFNSGTALLDQICFVMSALPSAPSFCQQVSRMGLDMINQQTTILNNKNKRNYNPRVLRAGITILAVISDSFPKFVKTQLLPRITPVLLSLGKIGDFMVQKTVFQCFGEYGKRLQPEILSNHGNQILPLIFQVGLPSKNMEVSSRSCVAINTLLDRKIKIGRKDGMGNLMLTFGNAYKEQILKELFRIMVSLKQYLRSNNVVSPTTSQPQQQRSTITVDLKRFQQTIDYFSLVIETINEMCLLLDHFFYPYSKRFLDELFQILKFEGYNFPLTIQGRCIECIGSILGVITNSLFSSNSNNNNNNNQKNQEKASVMIMIRNILQLIIQLSRNILLKNNNIQQPQGGGDIELADYRIRLYNFFCYISSQEHQPIRNIFINFLQPIIQLILSCLNSPIPMMIHNKKKKRSGDKNVNLLPEILCVHHDLKKLLETIDNDEFGLTLREQFIEEKCEAMDAISILFCNYYMNLHSAMSSSSSNFSLTNILNCMNNLSKYQLSSAIRFRVVKNLPLFIKPIFNILLNSSSSAPQNNNVFFKTFFQMIGSILCLRIEQEDDFEVLMLSLSVMMRIIQGFKKNKNQKELIESFTMSFVQMIQRNDPDFHEMFDVVDEENEIVNMNTPSNVTNSRSIKFVQYCNIFRNILVSTMGQQYFNQFWCQKINEAIKTFHIQRKK